MDLKGKITEILNRAIEDTFISLEGDDKVFGFVVSPKFTGMSSLARQDLIEEILGTGPAPLTSEEQRRVLMIAALSPVEYDTVGAKITVNQVRQKGAAVEVVLHGRRSDAEYVQGVLKNQKDVEIGEPKPSEQVPNYFYFRAKGTKTNPLTTAKAIRLLEKDPYISVQLPA